MQPFELPKVTVTIDEHTYTISTLDAVVARQIWVPLFKALGGALEALPSIEGNEQKGAAVFGKFVHDLPVELVDTMVRIYGNSSTLHIGEREPKVSEVYITHFAGRPAHQIKWLLECTKVNFRDFLDGSSGLNLSALVAAVSK